MEGSRGMETKEEKERVHRLAEAKGGTQLHLKDGKGNRGPGEEGLAPALGWKPDSPKTELDRWTRMQTGAFEERRSPVSHGSRRTWH